LERRSADGVDDAIDVASPGTAVVIASAIPTLVLIAAAAVLAPIIAEGLRRFVAVPEVVVQIVFGIILGPYVLAVVHPNNVVSALSDFGLTYLMFLAGTELDVTRMRDGHMRVAAAGWVVSLALGLAVGAVLVASDLVHDTVVFALCLTTTALGTLLPILRDAHVFETGFGPILLAVGAVGEFGPVVAVAVLLTTKNAPVTIALLVVFVVLAAVAALLAMRVHPPRLVALLRRHLHTTSQLPVRISVLLVFLLVYLTLQLGLDVLLGAFAAGIVVRLFIAGEDSELVIGKLEAIGFGFLIPTFFIVSGVNFDLEALVHQPGALARVPRVPGPVPGGAGRAGAPLYRRLLGRGERWALALFSATGLPLIVVITTIGVSEGKMRPVNAAALVAAGMVSVLVYPLLGLGRLRTTKGPASRASAEN